MSVVDRLKEITADGERLQLAAVRRTYQYVALKAAHRHSWTSSCRGRRDKKKRVNVLLVCVPHVPHLACCR